MRPSAVSLVALLALASLAVGACTSEADTLRARVQVLEKEKGTLIDLVDEKARTGPLLGAHAGVVVPISEALEGALGVAKGPAPLVMRPLPSEALARVYGDARRRDAFVLSTTDPRAGRNRALAHGYMRCHRLPHVRTQKVDGPISVHPLTLFLEAVDEESRQVVRSRHLEFRMLGTSAENACEVAQAALPRRINDALVDQVRAILEVPPPAAADAGPG